MPVPCVIVDIDGTLADCSHRRHFVEGETKDWKSFLNPDLVGQDTLISAVSRVVVTLYIRHIIVFVSGRPDSLRVITQKWLDENLSIAAPLYMRKEGDYRADTIVKREILQQLRAEGYEPWLAIDDRASVVTMWREEGITCFQVAEGDF